MFSFDPAFPEGVEVSGLAVPDFEHADSTAASIRIRANVMKTDFLGSNIFRAPLDF
jgi:hypothetical protein